MLIELNRGGELWWMQKYGPYRNIYLRYGVKRPLLSHVATFGYVVKIDDRDCVTCTDAGAVLLYKAKWGSAYNEVSYMLTLEKAMELVLHMARNHAGYLRQPVHGRSWCDCMLPFETSNYKWERVEC